jgi:hypothetical protein
MTSIIREPLFHFLLIGAALFVIFGFVDERKAGGVNDQIVVSAGRIQQFENIFAKTWHRPPTADELKGLIDDFVLEEIYYRQAVAMGIDRDDTVIRRRMRQKFEFLTDDMAATNSPSDEALAAYLAANADEYIRDNTYTFEQVYINPDRSSTDPDRKVAEQLAALQAGAPPTGNSGLLPAYFDAVPARLIDSSFGTGFSSRLDTLSAGTWQGPIESGLGQHLIRVDSRTEGALPDLADIRPIVEREWANDKRLETRQQINEKLLSNYEVVIAWPTE